MLKIALNCLPVLVLLAGCGARQEITLGPAAAIEARVELELMPAFSAYLADLSALSGQSKKDQPVIDPLKLRRELSRFPGISGVSVGATRDRLDLRFKSADLAGFLEARPEVFGGVLAFSRQGAARRLEATLDRRNVRRFLQFAPAEMRPLLEVLLPPQAGRQSSEEYADYLAWAFEEYSQPKTVLEALRRLKIIVTAGAPGGIVSQAGGRMQDDRAVFELPLLELLSSGEPRRYSVVWN